MISSKKKINGAKKGKAFERQIANELGHIFPDAQRLLEFQASGNIGTDLQHTDVFQFQCKRYANYAPIGKINEVKIQSKEHIPVLVTQGNRMECMAVLPFEKFVTLLEIAYGLSPRLVHPDLRAQMNSISLPMALPDTKDHSAYLEEITVDCPTQCNALDSLI
jgi:hypothetical protein